MKYAIFFIYLVTLVSCQNAPTKVIQESAQSFEKNGVLIDTRSPFLYESSHIEGSSNLWWEDFLILKNPKSKIRVFDPDLKQTVERLAHKGITPQHTIYLIGSKADSLENKKWKWLLSYLEVKAVHMKSIDEIRKLKQGQMNRFAPAERENPWPLLTSEDFQKDLIENKAPRCFLKWDEKYCL